QGVSATRATWRRPRALHVVYKLRADRAESSRRRLDATGRLDDDANMHLKGEPPLAKRAEGRRRVVRAQSRLGGRPCHRIPGSDTARDWRRSAPGESATASC